MSTQKIGFGGSCHWCTEAVFQSLKGVEKVEQGWISAKEAEAFHEAVIVHFNEQVIPLAILIEVHLRTHNSTSDHSMRRKYRSAVYTFSEKQRKQADQILTDLQTNFSKPLITRTYSFKKFRTSAATFQNYYLKNPDKPFCKSYIDPKLKLLLDRFGDYLAFSKKEEMS